MVGGLILRLRKTSPSTRYRFHTCTREWSWVYPSAWRIRTAWKQTKLDIRCQSRIVGNYRQTVLAICLLAGGNQGLTISKGDISNVCANVGQGNEESTSSSMCTSPLSSHLTLGILRGIHKYSTPDAYAIAHDKCIIICLWINSEAGKI